MCKKYKATRHLYISGSMVADKDEIVLVTDNYSIINKARWLKFTDCPNVVKEWITTKCLLYIPDTKENKVDHPSHYTWLKEKCGIEVIDITRHLDFCIGNAVKYLLRAGYKSEEGYSDKEKEIEDLKKAVWYINDKIKMIESNG